MKHRLWRIVAALPVLVAGSVAVSAAQVPPDLAVTRIDDRTQADLDGPRTITLTLAQPMAVREMLLLLVRGTPFSLVLDEQVEGTFTGELKNLSMRQALEAVLFPRDLEYEVKGSLIRVFPRRQATRMFDINFLNLRRSAHTTVGGGITTSAQADPYGDLTNGIERMLSPSGRAHVDRTAGLVQVTDFADRLDRIGVYLEAVEARANRQVRFDARVVEVTMAAGAGALDLGPSPPTSGLQPDEVDALLRSLAGQGAVRTIAAPRLVAMNNEPAVMRVGAEAVRVASKDDAAALLKTDEGLTLVVTAQIAPDGIVLVHVAPRYAARRTADARGSVLDVDAADTTVRVREGETIVLSGFSRDRTKTVPASGLPGLFGAESRQAVRSELLVLLTPTVVSAGRAPAAGSR